MTSMRKTLDGRSGRPDRPVEADALASRVPYFAGSFAIGVLAGVKRRRAWCAEIANARACGPCKVRAPSMGQWAVRQCIAKIGNELSRARSMTSSVPRQPRWCHASSSASTQALLRTCCPEVGHDFKRRRSEERHLIDLACSPPCLARRGRGDRRWVTASSSARSRPGTVRKFRS